MTVSLTFRYNGLTHRHPANFCHLCCVQGANKSRPDHGYAIVDHLTGHVCELKSCYTGFVRPYSSDRSTCNNRNVFGVPEETHGNEWEVETAVCFPEAEPDKSCNANQKRAQYMCALPGVNGTPPVETLFAMAFSVGYARQGLVLAYY
jgi:hypothetical protein